MKNQPCRTLVLSHPEFGHETGDGVLARLVFLVQSNG